MKRLDPTIIIGLLIGVAAIVAGAMAEGVRLKFLWQPTAALVVVGGTVGAVTVRRGLGGLRRALRACASLLIKESTDELRSTVARLAWLARTARRDGVRTLESYAESTNDPLVAQALLLAASYAEPTLVRASLDRILAHEDAAGLREAATFEAAGSYAPTFGILGAVLGLIHVLRSLADPGALGLGIATAFVATIYGVGSANLLLFPIASRLRERHDARMRLREALAESLVALASNETPGAITDSFDAYASLVSMDDRRVAVRRGAR